jgi:glycosyltransferase involved in cell wall biosynthesis
MENIVVVDVVMTTYNHEKYIAKAIESVIAQKTDFSIRLIIGEDASTDDTLLICRRYANLYPEKILLIENHYNLGLIQNYLMCFSKCDSEFVAILEGDDYWTSVDKLQRQVDFFKNNDDYGLVHSNFYSFDENKMQIIQNPERLVKFCNNTQGKVYTNLLWNNFIVPLTVLFRKELLKGIDKAFLVSSDLLTIDYYLWLYFSNLTKIGYQNDVFGVYNISENSISNNSDILKKIRFETTKEKIYVYILKKYPNEKFKIENYLEAKDVYVLFKAMTSINLTLMKKYVTKFRFNGLVRLLKLKLLYFK